jgi:predicted ATP-grasp superfamily ATP-dependent carboligase
MAIPNPPVCVIGASVRAAAFSAIRAGFTPFACDLFGDADLRACARFVPPAGAYPGGLAVALEALPPAPVVYTGGLEGHAELVERLARRRELWGNGASCLRAVRDPLALAAALRQDGVEPPPARRGDDPPSGAGWLWKPLGGAGGRGIRRAGAGRKLPAAGGYFQREVEGLPCSSVHLAGGGGCQLLGATRQLVGEAWLHAPPFAWCGNVGPLELEPRVRRALEAAGERAARQFALRGLFGIDFLLDGGLVRPLELNPRYPASTEILEHAIGFPALALHAAACCGATLAALTPVRPPRILGKAVVYAPAAVTPARDLLSVFPPDPARLPAVADLPPAGAAIRRGRPLVTVFAAAASPEAVEGELRRQAGEVLRHFQRLPLRPYWRA